jgi:nicotinamidase/pyrazinamidase
MEAKKMKKALVIVDMLNDFVVNDDYYKWQQTNPLAKNKATVVEPAELRRYAPLYEGKLVVPGAHTLIQNIAQLKQFAENYGVVVYANDAHPETSEEFKAWPVHCVKDTYGAKVIDELLPDEMDVIVEKDDLGMFTNKEADKLLREKGVDELYITGVATEYCVKAAAMGAIKLGYKVNLVVDAIAGVDEIVLPNGKAVPETKGAIAKALMEMGDAGIKPIYTANALEEMVKR